MANNKRAALYADAERLYVQDQLTLEAIAKKLGCSVRTLTSWKGEGNWEGKRNGFIDLETSLHSDLYRLAQLITRRNLAILEEEKESGPAGLVNEKQMSVAFRAISIVKNVVAYEETEVSPKEDSEQKQGLTEDTVKKIEEAILGIKR